MTGTLFGVGLGPGDPDLITLRAARLIAACPVIAYPRLVGGDSFARSIAADLIPECADEIAIDLPITVDRAPAQSAYDRGAAEIGAALEAGRDVACLCEGDPFFFGSFMYLFARLSTRFTVEVVPGVTSVSAASARGGMPLAARNQNLVVVPAPLPAASLKAAIASSDCAAVVKLGRHLPKVRDVVADLGLTEKAIYAARVSLADERICPLAEAPSGAPYFSMVIVSCGVDPWL